jgi:hypothetical protein
MNCHVARGEDPCLCELSIIQTVRHVADLDIIRPTPAAKRQQNERFAATFPLTRCLVLLVRKPDVTRNPTGNAEPGERIGK